MIVFTLPPPCEPLQIFTPFRGLLFQKEGILSNFCSGIFSSRETVVVVQIWALSCRDHQFFPQTLLARQGKSHGGLWSKACSVNFLKSIVPEASLVPFVHKIDSVPAICLQLQVAQNFNSSILILCCTGLLFTEKPL